MESARVTLLDCTISGCRGPGLDCSGRAQATIHGGSIHSNVGGVWAWDGAAAVLRGAAVAGGPSHALLADGGGSLDVQVMAAAKSNNNLSNTQACAVMWRGGGRMPLVELVLLLLLLLVLLQCRTASKTRTSQACT